MQLQIFNTDPEEYDIILSIDNINCIPNKGDDVYINGRDGVVSHFLWNFMDKENVKVTMFIDFR
jgi:hypothetical protein